MAKEVKILNDVIEEIISKIERGYAGKENISYKDLENIIEEYKKKLNNKDYCLLQKWLENNFGTNKKSDKNTFGANFVDLIRNGFFFDEKNLMGSFAENVIGDIAECERKTICNEIMCNQYKLPTECEKGECLDLIKNKIGDPFLKDNLLYFKKKDAENGD